MLKLLLKWTKKMFSLRIKADAAALRVLATIINVVLIFLAGNSEGLTKVIEKLVN